VAVTEPDPRPLDADLVSVRPGLPRGLVITVGTAAVLVAALGLQAFAEVVGPVFLALLLSIVVQPVRRFPVRHGLPAWLGTALSLVAVYAMVVALVAILVISGVQLAGLLADYEPQFEASVKSLGTKLEAAGISQAQLEAVQANANPGKLLDLVAGLLGGVAGILGSITFLILLLFFTVTDAAAFATNVAHISPAGRRLALTFQLFATGSRRYLAVATIFGAGVALLDVVALYILDIRYAWLWGLLALCIAVLVAITIAVVWANPSFMPLCFPSDGLAEDGSSTLNCPTGSP